MATQKTSKDKGATAKAPKKELSLEQRIHKALSHPLRVQILDLLNAGEWSPRELERELDENLGQISYHVKVLRDFELIEMTRTRPARGAVEHFYRALVRAYLPAGMAKDMPKSAQRVVGNRILGKIDNDVASALKSGSFYARDDWHTSWTPTDLDDQGRRDAERLTDKYLEDLMEIEAESANRRAASEEDDEHIGTTVAVLIFGSDLAERETAQLRNKRRKSKKRRGS